MQKFFFKLIPLIHVFIYRLTGGRLGSEMRGFNVLLLNSVGRKSGQTRTNPLGYFVDGGNYIVIASNAGFDTHPAWYHNLKANPHTTIQVKSQIIKVKAETANSTERQRLWAELMKIAPGYADYEKQTKREIPVVVLRPVG
jgi:deazaflavin-dependent oxidoreductase (nitroreductase family)